MRSIKELHFLGQIINTTAKLQEFTPLKKRSATAAAKKLLPGYNPCSTQKDIKLAATCTCYQGPSVSYLGSALQHNNLGQLVATASN